MATAIPRLDEANLQALCAILGETDGGLTGTEIGQYLSECGIADPAAGITKRHRLYAALAAVQSRDNSANTVLRFVKHAVNPVRYVGRREVFESRRFRSITCSPSAASRSVRTESCATRRRRRR